MVMNFIMRLARRADRKQFLALAAERDMAIKRRRKTSFWNRKFLQLLKSKQLIVALLGGKIAGFLYFSRIFSDDPPVFYVDLVYFWRSERHGFLSRG